MAKKRLKDLDRASAWGIEYIETVVTDPEKESWRKTPTYEQQRQVLMIAVTMERAMESVKAASPSARFIAINKRSSNWSELMFDPELVLDVTGDPSTAASVTK